MRMAPICVGMSAGRMSSSRFVVVTKIARERLPGPLTKTKTKSALSAPPSETGARSGRGPLRHDCGSAVGRTAHAGAGLSGRPRRSATTTSRSVARGTEQHVGDCLRLSGPTQTPASMDPI